MTSSATPTAQRLLDAAEELVAELGADAVSTRQIIAKAGVGNMGAIQYHFRSRDGLLAAVVTRALEPLERERAIELRRLEALPVITLHDVSTAYVRPMARLRRAPHGDRTAKVMGRMLGLSRDRLEALGAATVDDTEAAFKSLFTDRTPLLGDRERHLRLQAALAVVVFHALGYTEHPTQPAGDVEETTAQLATAVTAIMAAPPTTTVTADVSWRVCGP
jgi:AcrR family transcriptional regulator